MTYLLPRFRRQIMNLQVAKRQEDTSGWVVCGGGKMPPAKFLKMVFPNPLFFPANLHLEEKNSYATIVDPPPKCSKGSCFLSLLFEAHSALATRTKSENHGEHSAYCWWTKSCTTNHDDYPIIYRVFTIPGGAGFCPSTVVIYNVVKKIYQDNLKHRREEVLAVFFFPHKFGGFYLGAICQLPRWHGIPMKQVGCNNKCRKLSVQWPK